jgi:hypothetical protein
LGIYKKSIILSPAIYDGKSEEKGILTLQKEDSKTTGTLKCFNFSELPGKMLLGITFDNGDINKFSLEQDKLANFKFNLSSDCDLTKKISCAVVNINGSDHNPIIWGSTESSKNYKTQIMQSFEQNNITTDRVNGLYEKKENNLSPNKMSTNEIFSQLKEEEWPKDDYIDEEVEQLIDKEVSELEEELNFEAYNKFKNFKSLKQKEQDKKVLVNKQKINAAQQKELEEAEEEGFLNNDLEETTFYEDVKGQIDSLFEQYPREEALEEIIPNSHFVRVDFNGDGESYIFGLIYDDNSNPEYIVYGIPALYTKTPPSQLEGYYQWLPLDLEKPEEDGYWLMYQSALTGEHIKVDII